GSRNDGNFCVKCGTPKPVFAFEPFFCSKCGEKISDPETVFCPRCGNKVK
ncbi:MAG: zinc-ribbon domain-containing protein, partial [Erysipelotrichaceae bacterium]|nr:zinc-ribbon domain-containing protein [Erysipelotrichaceae bacterium]